MSDKGRMLGRADIDFYLKDLSKEIKKEFGRKIRLELVIVGGASIIINYGFRNSTMDIDAYISNGTSVKDAVRRVADRYGLEEGWLNSDFMKTASYSQKLTQYSRFYRVYNQVLTVRTIDAENLIAMKLASFRAYKHDRSDIIGILKACSDAGVSLDIDKIKRAVINIYGDWDYISQGAKEFIKEAAERVQDYDEVSGAEINNKVLLREFESKNQGVLKRDNLEKILSELKKKQGEELQDL